MYNTVYGRKVSQPDSTTGPIAHVFISGTLRNNVHMIILRIINVGYNYRPEPVLYQLRERDPYFQISQLSSLRTTWYLVEFSRVRVDSPFSIDIGHAPKESNLQIAKTLQ